jgi:head-tail adaptor
MMSEADKNAAEELASGVDWPTAKAFLAGEYHRVSDAEITAWMFRICIRFPTSQLWKDLTANWRLIKLNTDNLEQLSAIHRRR